MHTVTDTIQQQTDAITQRVNDASERLGQHLERSAQRFIVRMAIFIVSSIALTAAFYTLR